VHLLFPYFEGTDLSEFTKGNLIFQEHEVKQVIRALLSMLVYLDQIQVVHRNLKPTDGFESVAIFRKS
jgi:serine/threonine protein kinase